MKPAIEDEPLTAGKPVSRRYSRAFTVAAAALMLAFVADTASTCAAGAAVIPLDLNPVTRSLSVKGYLAWSLIRLALGLLLLTVCWPRRLVMREPVAARGSWLALVVPFAYRSVRAYVVAALIMIVTPVKLLAAVSNVFVLTTGRTPASVGTVIGFGLVLGVLLANALLLWHHRTVGQPEP